MHARVLMEEWSLNHFTKSNKKSDHAKLLQLRFHFNDHISPITVQPHVPVVDFRSEKIKTQFLPP